MSEPTTSGPDPRHTAPTGLSDALVEALGTLSEAFETVERARGRLYDFHQLTGGADATLGTAVRQLREAGATAEADLLEHEILGRNVVPGMWTFQLVEAYDDTYYRAFAEAERGIRDRLADGRRHLHEARMKQARRTTGHPDHTTEP